MGKARNVTSRETVKKKKSRGSSLKRKPVIELVSTSQSTIVSESDHCDVISVLTSDRTSGIFYYRLEMDNEIPLLRLLNNVFVSCSRCVATGELICDHIEDQLWIGYCKLKIQFSSAVYGHHTSNEVVEKLKFSKDDNKKLPKFVKDRFTACVIAGDGNCFFSAVSVCMSLDPVFGKTVRRCGLIALSLDYDLKDKLSKLSSEDIIDQKRILGNDGVWASRHSVFIASEFVSRPISVYTYKPNTKRIIGTTYDSRSGNKNQPIYLWLENGHFSSLILNPGVVPPIVKYELPEFREKIKKQDTLLHIRESICTKSNGTSSDTIIPLPEQVKAAEDLGSSLLEENKNLCYNFRDALPRNNEHRTFSTKFNNADTECYNMVLKYIKVDMENLYRMSQTTQINAIKQYVASTESWDLFTQRILHPRKINKTKQKVIQRKIYYKQRSRQGQEQFLLVMNEAGLDATLQHAYLDFCIEKFGSLSEPISLPLRTSNTIFNGIPNENKNNAKPSNYEPNYQKTTSDQKSPSAAKDVAENETDKVCGPTIKKLDFKEEQEKNINQSLDSHSVSNKGTPPNVKLSDTEESNDEYEDFKTRPGDIPKHKKEAVCEVLKIDAEDLEYKPPRKFKLLIKANEFRPSFNFKTMRFRSYKWPNIINNAIVDAHKVCGFNSKRPPYYYENGNPFCRLNGKCSGACRMQFKVIIKDAPVKGQPVKCYVSSKGDTSLVQSKATGRQLRGTARDKMKEKLKHTKASKVYYDNILETKGLRTLHKNELQKSMGVLRKARSEVNNKDKLHTDPIQDLILQKEKYINEDQSNKPVQGFIQDINPTPGSFKVVLFSRESLLHHASQVKSGYNECFLDATGGIFKKMSNKTPLFYVLMGKNHHNISYPIAEFILEDGSNVEIMHCLTRIRYAMKTLRPSSDRLFTNLLVVDWSWSMIHAVCKGVNHMELLDYLQNSFNLLNGEPHAWNSRHSCIFICSSHLIAATKRLFSKALTNARLDKPIMKAALNAVARTQECYNFTELREVLAIVIRTFGLQFIPKNELDKNLLYLGQKKTTLDVLLKSEHDSEKVILPPEDDANINETLYSQSPFFRLFESVKVAELNTGKWRSLGCIRNPYYNLTLLNQFGRYKVPFFPLWAAAVPRATYNPSFLRETSAVVESSFNSRKTNFLSRKNQLVSSGVRELCSFHRATLHDATIKDISADQKSFFTSSKKTLDSELKTEKWSSGKPSKRQSRHFTDRNVFTNLSGKQRQTTVNFPKNGLPHVNLNCYMNAVFQLTMCMPVWFDVAFSGKLTDPFLTIFNGIHLKPITEKIVEVTKKEIDELTEYQFPSGTQHDPHEFLKTLLFLEKATEQGLKETVLPFLKDSFQIKTERLLKCNGCSYSSLRNEELFEIVVLPTQSAQDNIDKIQALQMIPDYRCEACGSSASKKDELLEISEYVLVVTEQYDSQSDITQPKKVNMLPELNVPELTLKVPTRKGLETMELVSFISHEGNTLHSGHYRTYLPDGDGLRCCDDQNVYATKKHRGTIYIQMYRRI